MIVKFPLCYHLVHQCYCVNDIDSLQFMICKSYYSIVQDDFVLPYLCSRHGHDQNREELEGASHLRVPLPNVILRPKVILSINRE